MIHIFNRAILFKDTDAQTAAKIRSQLQKAGIPYRMKKEDSGSAKSAVRIPRTGRTGNMGVDSYSVSYMNGGVPHSWTESNSQNILYIIYVQKKDSVRAKELCDIT